MSVLLLPATSRAFSGENHVWSSDELEWFLGDIDEVGLFLRCPGVVVGPVDPSGHEDVGGVHFDGAVVSQHLREVSPLPHTLAAIIKDVRRFGDAGGKVQRIYISSNCICMSSMGILG